MEIKSRTTTRFQKNLIIETSAEIRFPRNLQIEDELPVAFQKELESKFPLLNVGKRQSVNFNVGPSDNPSEDNIERLPPINVYRLRSIDKKTCVSLSCDSLSVSLSSYETWRSFEELLGEVFDVFSRVYNPHVIERSGLRYKDLIKRSELGLDAVQWGELVQPFVIGHFTSELFENPLNEKALIQGASISHFNLENYQLILQSAFVDKNGETCLIIDSDFFKEENIMIGNYNLSQEFGGLHADAGALFESCLKRRLRDAMLPIQGDTE